MKGHNNIQLLKWWPRIGLQRLILPVLLPLLLIVGLTTLVVASDITGAEYQGNIEVSNNGTDTENVVTVFSLNTTSLIDTGKLNSSASNCAIRTATGTDVAFMPSNNSSNPWVIFIPSINEDQTLYEYLYTGDVTGGELRYFPGDTGMTADDDDADFELGDNFITEQRLFVDTTSDYTILIFKPGAYQVYASSGDVTAAIYVTGQKVDYYDTNDDSNSATILGDEWRCQTFTASQSYVAQTIQLKMYKNSGGTGTVYLDVHLLDESGEPTGSPLTTATRTYDDFTLSTSGDWYTFNITDYALTNGTEYGIEVRASGSNGCRWVIDSTSATYSGGEYLNSANGGSSWTHNSNQDTMFRVYGAVVNKSVTASGLSPALMKVKVTADATNLKIYIDDVEKDSEALGGASVPNNSSEWSYLTGGGIPYMEYTKIWIDGTLVQHIEWEYTDGDFQDQSEYNNDATPTYRTTSSDPDVSAELTSFKGIKTSVSPPASGQEGFNIMVDVPSAPAGFFNEFDPNNMTFFGAGVISEFNETTDIPLELIVFPYAFGLAIIFGLAAWYFSSGGKKPHGRGSLLAQALVSLLVMIYFVYGAGGVIPAWVLLPFGIETLVLIVWRQTPSPF